MMELNKYVVVKYVVDVDECAEGHQCEDWCENTWGSYVCLCRKLGTVLAPDGFSCMCKFVLDITSDTFFQQNTIFY